MTKRDSARLCGGEPAPSAGQAAAPGPVQTALPQGLVRLLSGLPPLAVAFSGGIDSRFLCHAALLGGCDVLAVHARGPHVPAEESDSALAWARARGLSLLVVDFDPLPLPEVAANSRLRCYACKQGLLATVAEALARAGEAVDNAPAGKGHHGARLLCDGSNADDLTAFRPGLRALKEAGVVSPLAEAGMSKGAIRAAARATGLDDPDQCARPCLLTRLAYGLAPQKDVLHRIAAAERCLAALRDNGDVGSAASGLVAGCALGDFRLRLVPQPVLQVQFLPEALESPVRRILEAHGFMNCELLVGQGVSGFFDRPPVQP
ncbi:PP-loop family protein [Desulfovibrio sp.]|uniref:PP-loop family protein n=1 Tax=Desulfovibrio sp. TaxID=885 RepID=UPI0025BDF623|nr:PP-loop family protein [Desulfovibrio sp.]